MIEDVNEFTDTINTRAREDASVTLKSLIDCVFDEDDKPTTESVVTGFWTINMFDLNIKWYGIAPIADREDKALMKRIRVWEARERKTGEYITDILYRGRRVVWTNIIGNPKPAMVYADEDADVAFWIDEN